jgi:Carboxypeptidase regulatory-like domain
MWRSFLRARVLPVLALAIVITCIPVLCAAKDSGSGSIAGRVLDAATKKPVAGTVVVALENQPGNGAIVNATSPDANGNFSFTNVKPGNYAVVVSGIDVAKRTYAPVLVVGKGIAPGANLGTISLKSAGKNAAVVNVPVRSNKPITVTLAVNQKIGEQTFAIPWADGTPTFDTVLKAGCSSGTACTTYRVQVPSSGLLMANFDGSSVQYLPNPVPSKYSVMASAFTQNGAKPTCESHNSAPFELKSGNARAIVFTGCE